MNLPEKPSPSESSDSLLGTIRKHEPPTPPKFVRYYLQSVARDLLPDKRVAICSRAMTDHQVSIRFHELNCNARFGGLMMCCSVWSCPVCATRITEERRAELERGTLVLQERGHISVMMTMTIRHEANQTLDGLLSSLKDAMQRLKRGKPWQKFKARHGIIGGVYSLEVTWGAGTGWHPHRHELMFLDHPLDDNEHAKMEHWLKERYLKMLVKAGGDASYENGLSLDVDTVDNYIAKFGREPYWHDSDLFRWTQVHEVTKAPAKQSKDNERMTPFAMLVKVAEKVENANEIAERFQEYADTMHGTRQLIWWRGTKDLLGIKNVSDDDIVNDDDGYTILGYITRRGWDRVLYMKWRSELLDVASKGDLPALKEWCRVHEIDVEDWAIDDWNKSPCPTQSPDLKP